MMQLDPVIGAEIDRERRKLVRTSAIFTEDQIEAIESISGGKRGNGKRKFARMLRLVVDAGILAVQSNKTPRRAAKHKRGVSEPTAVVAEA